MEEKFYYSKGFIKRWWLNVMLTGTFLIVLYVVFIVPFFGSVPFLLLAYVALPIVILALSLVRFLFERNKPAIVLSNERVALGPLSIIRAFSFTSQVHNWSKFEIDIGRIVSANTYEALSSFFSDGKKRMRILFKDDSNKESALDIILNRIDNPERLIEIFKRRIKFE